jgi:cytochrome bd-type quinol oxidase subunit 2
MAFAQKTWDDVSVNPNGCVIDGIPTLGCFDVVLTNLVTMSSALIVIVLFVMFIIGGLSYLTSGGDHEKVQKAQGTLKYALIGTILFVSAFLIIKVIDVLFLGGNSDLFKFSIDAEPPVQAP